MRAALLILAVSLGVASFGSGFVPLRPPEPLRIGGGEIHDVAYSPDGELLALAAQYGVWLLDGETFAELACLPARETPAQVLAFSPDGKVLAVGTGDGRVDLWDPWTREHLAALSHGAEVTALAFSPAGALLASGGAQGKVRIWDVRGQSLLSEFAAHEGEVVSLDFSPDGEELLSGGADGVAKVWDPEGKLLHALHHSGAVRALFWESWRAITAGGDGKILLWDLFTERTFRTLTHGGAVQGIGWAGGRLVSWGSDGRILRWDLETGDSELVVRLEEGVRKVSFAPDSAELVCLDSVGRPVHWPRRPESTLPLELAVSLLRILKGHTDLVYSVAFSPNGKLLASGSRDDTVKLWDVTTKKCIKTLKRHSSDVSKWAKTW